jgi:hypothetical protein
MIGILEGASFIRADAPQRHAQARASPLIESLGTSDVADRVWGLLATPQTLDSLCHSLAADESTEKLHDDVRIVLQSFYDLDLIEMSPDT